MILEPRRGHILSVFDRFLRDFGLIVIAAIYLLFANDWTLILQNSWIVILVVFSPVVKLIKYFCTYYSIDGEHLYVKSGLFVKKNLEIPLATITTVDMSQNIIYQAFGVYKLTIDNAGSMNDAASHDVEATFNGEDAKYIRGLLLSRRRGGKPEAAAADRDATVSVAEANTLHVPMRDIVKMALLQGKGIYFVILASAFSVGVGILSDLAERAGEAVLAGAWTILSGYGLMLAIVALIILVWISTFIMSLVISVIRYTNYTVVVRDNDLIIEYGLLTKKHFTLSREKISGIIYEQSILMRLFRCGGLDVSAIGYGDMVSKESGTNVRSMLYPIVSEAQFPELVKQLLPELSVEADYAEAEPKTFRFFFITPRFFIALALLLLSLFFTAAFPLFPWWCIGAVIVLVTAGSVVLEYKSAALSIDNKTVAVVNGGYTRKRVFMKLRKIESVSENAFVFKHRKGYTNITVGVFGPAADSSVRVRNMNMGVFQRVMDKMIY